MAGTVEGGRKAAAKNKANDPEFYQKIGAKGGANSRGGGFAYLKSIGEDDKIKEYGSLGGSKSRKTKNVQKVKKDLSLEGAQVITAKDFLKDDEDPKAWLDSISQGEANSSQAQKEG